jgi:hypothetical protein
MALTHKDKVILQNNDGVMLCKSHTPEGQPFFHYVLADKKNIEQMDRDKESGKVVDFSSYGEILLSGWGEKPTPEYEMIISEYFLTT